MPRLLIIFGLVILVAGLLWSYLSRLVGLGRLPDDIVIERENVTFYCPLVASLIISVVLGLNIGFLDR